MVLTDNNATAWDSGSGLNTIDFKSISEFFKVT
jgi:hypothetical protein